MDAKPAFDTLLETHGQEIFAYLWRMFQGDPEAEDCFQDTFMKALRAYGGVQAPWNYRAWLYRIATNTANTHFRRRNRQAAEPLPSSSNLPHPGETVPDQVARQISLEEITQAVDELPPKQRNALLLRKYQGFAYKDIGEILDMSPESARANAYQGLKKLRARFNPSLDEQAPNGAKDFEEFT